LIVPQDDGILVIPTVADGQLKLNTTKGFSSEFHDKTFALSSIASVSGCCQVICHLLGSEVIFFVVVSYSLFYNSLTDI